MKIFFLFFVSLFFYLSYLIGTYYTDSFALTGFPLFLVWGLNILLTLTIFLAPYVYRVHPKDNPDFFYNALQWVGYIVFGIYSVLVVFMLIDLSILFFVEHSKILEREKVIFLKSILALISLVIAFIVSSFGFVEARRKPMLKKIKVPLSHLPAEFDGVVILQISDLHVGQTIKADYVEALVEMSNDLKPDIVVLTGDMTDGSRFQLEKELQSFKKLNAPLGKFMVPGNHEYYWGVTSWISFWKEIGFRTLLNEHALIEKNQAQLVMAGVHDYSAKRLGGGIVSSPAEAIAGAPLDAVKILLAHQPRSVYAAAKVGFHLQLSGHTHSGQYFPYNLLIYLFQPYVKGLNQFKKTWIYVNQGTGYWGPPSRFGVPPEVTLIELIKAPSAF